MNLFLMGIFLILVCVLHELAHAFVALLLGMRVFGVSIGSGRTIYKSHLLGFEVEINVIPWGGATLSAPKNAGFVRLKGILVTSAGPLVHLVVPVVAFFLLRPQHLTDWLSRGGFLPFHALLLANLLALYWSVWPRLFKRPGLQLASDGLALIRYANLSEAEMREVLAMRYFLESAERLERKRYQDADQWVRSGLKEDPTSILLLFALGDILVKRMEFVEAREVYLQLLAIQAEDEEVKTAAMRHAAWTDVLMGKVDLLEEADRFSKEAYDHGPKDIESCGTRGAVLVALGRSDEGLPFLRWSMANADDPVEKALSACFIALGELGKGKTDEARRYWDAAKLLDAHCVLLGRVEEMFNSSQSGQVVRVN